MGECVGSNGLIARGMVSKMLLVAPTTQKDGPKPVNRRGARLPICDWKFARRHMPKDWSATKAA
jgi:hypothetical protein